MEMEIANLRLVNQLIAENKFSTVRDIVAWMGAMQAQDYPMAKWAIGSRLPNSTDQQIESKKIISNNGIFRPVLVVNGLVKGTWKHFIRKDSVTIELNFSQSPDHSIKNLAQKKAKRYGQFLTGKTYVINLILLMTVLSIMKCRSKKSLDPD